MPCQVVMASHWCQDKDDSIEMRHATRLETGSTLGSIVFRSLVICAMVAGVLAGCAPAAGEPEAKAVSQAQPIAQAMSTTPVTFVAATSGAYVELVPGSVNSGPNPTRPVWAIDFKGVFSLSCAQSDTPHCPVNATLPGRPRQDDRQPPPFRISCAELLSEGSWVTPGIRGVTRWMRTAGRARYHD